MRLSSYNFQFFVLIQHPFHEMILFGGFLGPNSPKYCPILTKFLPEVVFNERKSVLRIFEKFKFLRKQEIPKVCTFDLTLTHRFFLKMAEIEQNKYSARKTLAVEVSKYRKIKALSPLSFLVKIRLLVALFWLFLAGNRPRSKVKGSESKFEIAFFSRHLPVKKV